MNSTDFRRARYVSPLVVAGALLTASCSNDRDGANASGAPRHSETQAQTSQTDTGDSNSDIRKFVEELMLAENGDDFRRCQNVGLEKIFDRWTLSQAEIAELQPIVDKYSGTQLTYFAINYATDENLNIAENDRDRHLLYFFKIAAEQGSPIAQNELGASLLYCYHGVSQDITAAQTWLEAAANQGDPIAGNSLARMHIMGMIEAPERLDRAREFLEQCGQVRSDVCRDTRKVFYLLEDQKRAN